MDKIQQVLYKSWVDGGSGGPCQSGSANSRDVRALTVRGRESGRRDPRGAPLRGAGGRWTYLRSLGNTMAPQLRAA